MAYGMVSGLASPWTCPWSYWLIRLKLAPGATPNFIGLVHDPATPERATEARQLLDLIRVHRELVVVVVAAVVVVHTNTHTHTPTHPPTHTHTHTL